MEKFELWIYSEIFEVLRDQERKHEKYGFPNYPKIVKKLIKYRPKSSRTEKFFKQKKIRNLGK